MASLIISFQLSNSTGLGKIIRIDGLGYELIIHPTIHGEPILTSQAFYYLNNLDSIAKLNINNEMEPLSSKQIEYLIDNYLFEYSTINLNSKLTTKVTDFVYWKNNVHSLYQDYDSMNTGALIVDKYNDSAVQDIQPIDDNTCLSDWCIPKNYTDTIINNYVKAMQEVLDKKVFLRMLPNEYKNGYIGEKRILECDEGLLDLYQAEKLDSIRNINSEDTHVLIKSSFNNEYDVRLPIEDIVCDKLYNPLLLSYYFSGINDKNPLNNYVGYYNVLEYYFEEAPAILDVSARTEKEQLEAVIKLLVTNTEINNFIKDKSESIISIMQNDIGTSSSIVIQGLNLTESDLTNSLAKWLYDIRCAIVHSKKTRKGLTTAIFEPYSEESTNIKISLPIIRWLSILCIKKDYALGNGKTSL